MSNYLEKSKSKLMAQADYVSQGIEDWQTIQDFISNRVENITLNKRQKLKLERYEFAYGQLMSAKYTEAEVVTMLVDKFSVKRSTAVMDIQNTQEIFTITLGINKRFEIKIMLERLKIQLAKAAASAKLAEYAMLQRCYLDYLKLLPDENPNDAAAFFTPHINHIVFNPELLGYPAIDPDEWKKLISDLERDHKFKFDNEFIEDAILVDQDGE